MVGTRYNMRCQAAEERVVSSRSETPLCHKTKITAELLHRNNQNFSSSSMQVTVTHNKILHHFLGNFLVAVYIWFRCKSANSYNNQNIAKLSTALENFASALDGQQLVLAVVVVELHQVVPLLRQVRQRLQLYRLLVRPPPDPGRNTELWCKMGPRLRELARFTLPKAHLQQFTVYKITILAPNSKCVSHLARLDWWWLRLSNIGWLRYSCGEAALGIME